MTIGERIKQRREELGLRQEDLAAKLGYKSRTAISNVEKGKEDLTSTRIRKFAEALETTPADLMGWIDNAPTRIEVEVPRGDREEALSEYAKRLYENYQKASPEIQKAVDLLLKADK